MRCSRCDREDGTHEAGCGEEPKTTGEAFVELAEAWREFLLVIREAVLEWWRVLRTTRRDKGVATVELLTPEEFFDRVGVRVPESVIRNLEARRAGEKTADAVIRAAREIVDKGTILGMGDLQDALEAHDGEAWWVTGSPFLSITGELVADMCTRCIEGCHLDIPTGVMWHSPGCPHIEHLVHLEQPEQLELQEEDGPAPDRFLPGGAL